MTGREPLNLRVFFFCIKNNRLGTAQRLLNLMTPKFSPGHVSFLVVFKTHDAQSMSSIYQAIGLMT
jgi:hypothetical protein